MTLSRRDFTHQVLIAGGALGLARLLRALAATPAFRADAQRSGNPILPGWYADPEARIFENE